MEDARSEGPLESGDLREAVHAAVDYGIRVIEQGDEFPPPPPAALLAQALIAARSGLGLDAVLRRYMSGYLIFSDFLLEESDNVGDGIDASTVKRWQRTLAVVLEQFLARTSEEYAREIRSRTAPEDRSAKRIERLLAGEMLDTSRLGYDFDRCHLGLVAWGPDAPTALRSLSTGLDADLFCVRRAEEAAWGGLGSRRQFEVNRLDRHFRSTLPAHTTLAVGEPANGIAGWRRTHRQAKAAFTVAWHRSIRFARYSEVALISSVLRDELLVSTLRKLYFERISDADDDGLLLRTVRAYFEAGFNAKSAAAALEANRHTVSSRLRRVEERLGRSIKSCSAELSVVLDLDALGWPAPRSSPVK